MSENKNDNLLDVSAERNTASSNIVRTITITKFPILIALGFFAVIIIILIMNSNNSASETVEAEEVSRANSSRSSAAVLADNISDQGYRSTKKADPKTPPPQTSGINKDVSLVSSMATQPMSEHEIKLKQLREEMFISSITSKIEPINSRYKKQFEEQRKASASNLANNSSQYDSNNQWLSSEQARINQSLESNRLDSIAQGVYPTPQNYLANLDQPPLPNNAFSGLGNGSAMNVNNNQQSYDKWALDSEITAKPKSPFMLQTGSIINATLQTEINSDLEGMITGVVTQNIYDSLSGRYLLIPQGSRLIGMYGTDVNVGQQRLFVAWNRILFPDGRTLDIGEMNGTNTKGQAGFSDKLNTHFWRNMGNAVLLSLVGAGTSYALDRNSNNINDNGNNGTSVSSALADNFASQIGSLSVEMIRQGMTMSPTLEIRAGYQFNIMISKDVVFPYPYNFRK